MKLKDLPTRYDFNQVESGKYQEWVKNGFFTSGDISKKPYAMVIPPPNITGKLHLGHVLNNTIQDIIIRRKRMQGYDALWLPGMDHASIATQAKVEENLRKQGISRYDLGREEFLKVCWKWKEDHENMIHQQWARLGLSLDYTRERFTLDEGLSDAVLEVFVRMYQDGLIYRGERIINWDVQSRTALSNIEVEYKEIEGALYYIKYPFVDGNDGLVIATTRPETMFGDVALMVHPKDSRYQQYIGKKVYIPTTERAIEVIADEYVDMEFGTGVVKVTPAHDPNDFEVGLRHKLPRPLCMNEDGTMNELAGRYQGQERFECRKNLVRDLQEKGLLIKIEKIVHAVGHSERTGVVVEPRLSLQWFVKMEPLAKKVIEAQKNPETKISFIPARFEKIFINWLENIQDWCISRQLWWGHRIPAWYRGDEVYVGKTAPEGEGWIQDEDALDTWFSSALWPFSTFGWPNETVDLARYFPTDCLVTGYDIIFFWVARMAFQSLYFTGKRPFKEVILHGIIRDELGRKVSKSLGNGKDMDEAADEFGIDAVRYFITTASSPGQDVRYSDEKVQAAWNYINKIWNISRYIGLNFEQVGYTRKDINKEILNDVDKWILTRLNQVIKQYDEYLDKYEFNEASKVLYKFVWDDFASWYVELTKIVFSGTDEQQKENTCAVLDYCLRTILKLLHPFIPFVTDEIYRRFNEESIIISSWPTINEEFTYPNSEKIEVIFDIISSVRNIRQENNVPNSRKITLEILARDEEVYQIINENIFYLNRFINYDKLEILKDDLQTENKLVKVLEQVTIAIPLATLVDIEEEKKKLLTKKEELENEILRCDRMLNNPNFLAKAPEAKINEERMKRANYQEQLDEVLRLLRNF